MTSTTTAADTAAVTSGQVQDPSFGLDESTLDLLYSRDDQLICKACGTQYDKSGLTNCLICDDRKLLSLHVVLMFSPIHSDLLRRWVTIELLSFGK